MSQKLNMTTTGIDLGENNSRSCGGCGKYPKFLRKFANPRYFLVAFCIQNILQGASTSYFVGVATSIERQFHFTSKDFGKLIMLCEIGPITTSLLLSYFGGKGNRPRWLGLGMLISATGLLLSFSTSLLYPPPTLTESGHLLDSKKYCGLEDPIPKMETTNELTSTATGNFSNTTHEGGCYDSNNLVFFIWVMAYAFLGTGSMVVYSIGAPYLDDSIKKNDSPLYFAVIISVKIMGPFVGFGVSAAFLKLYVTPGQNPGITSLDPRWIGAWWGGILLFFLLNSIFGIIISFFPRDMSIRVNPLKSDPPSIPVKGDLPSIGIQKEYGSMLPNSSAHDLGLPLHEATIGQQDQKAKSKPPMILDFLSAMVRLLKNKVLVLTVITDVMAVTGILGFFLWLPKYLEHQFRVDKAESSLYTGIAGTSSVIIGILGGGLFIRQCQPTAKTLVLICIACKTIYIFSLIGLMFISCNFNDDLPGTYDREHGSLDVTHLCSGGCNCNLREFIPVCLTSMEEGEGEEVIKKETFFSPCHAGCPPPPSPLEGRSPSSSQLQEFFFNCTCSPSGGEVSLGYCEETCFAFTLYNLVNVVIKSFISVGAIGSLLINLRCVDPRDKAAALGLKGTMIAVGLLVAPMLFGALADSTCILWEEACGTRGSCWVYDTQQFGYKLHSASALLFLASLMFELVLSQNVGHISIMDPSSGLSASKTPANAMVSSTLSANSTVGDSGGAPYANGSFGNVFKSNPTRGSLRRSILKPMPSSHSIDNFDPKDPLETSIEGKVNEGYEEGD